MFHEVVIDLIPYIRLNAGIVYLNNSIVYLNNSIVYLNNLIVYVNSSIVFILIINYTEIVLVSQSCLQIYGLHNKHASLSQFPEFGFEYLRRSLALTHFLSMLKTFIMEPFQILSDDLPLIF